MQYSALSINRQKVAEEAGDDRFRGSATENRAASYDEVDEVTIACAVGGAVVPGVDGNRQRRYGRGRLLVSFR